MKKILLLLALFLTGFVPSVYACATNNDCPGNAACNVQTGICATPSDPNGTGTGFAAPTTQSTAATPAPTATTPTPAASVSTSNNFVPLTSIPAITSIANSTSNSLSGFFNNIYKICIGVAATLAVLQIIRAGIMYMGGDSITETKQARAMIISSIGGLVLVLSPAVVFGILNPNILSLQIGGSNGLSSLAPPPLSSGSGSAAATTPPAKTDPMCSGMTNPTWSTIPSGSSCNASFGAASVLLDSDCCSGTQPTGEVCCGTNSSYVPPTTPPLLSANRFSIAYQSTNDTTGQACVAYSDQGNFANTAACVTAYNYAISSEKTYAVSESCTDTGIHSLTGPGAATLGALPACPSN